MKLATSTLMLCVGAMLALSMVMLYSAAMHERGAHYLMMQLVWCAGGLVACVIGATVDYKHYKKLSWIAFGLVVLLLILVLVPHIGSARNGARRWFIYHSASLQPSELAKVMLILVLAHYGEHFQRKMGTFYRGVLIPAGFVGVTLGLVFIEPDRGTTILMAAVSGTMLLIAGVKLRYLFIPALLGGLGLAYSLMHDSMRIARIKAWWNPELSKSGVGYQTWQAMLALGSGGWTGLGLGNGRQKLGFVPERHTDFILSIIGEELGLVATLGIVIAFILFVICGVYIAWRARDTFGMLLASGITFLIGFQALINIGVVTSAFPNKGLSLPFISYGGSNLVVMLGCVGVLLSVARRAQVAQRVQSVEPSALEEAEAY